MKTLYIETLHLCAQSQLIILQNQTNFAFATYKAQICADISMKIIMFRCMRTRRDAIRGRLRLRCITYHLEEKPSCCLC